MGGELGEAKVENVWEKGREWELWLVCKMGKNLLLKKILKGFW